MSIQQNFSNTKPSLSLNFARSKQLDSRVSFTRSSSATYMDDNGLIVTAPVDSPRFDHDPATGDCLGLLIEESRTNLLTYSIPNVANWDGSGRTLTENNAIAPDGTQTATLFTGTGGSSVGHLLFKNSSLTTGTSYTQTFFVKAGTTEFVQILPSTGFNLQYANFQLTGNGVIGNYDVVTPPTIEKFPNGWYRIRVTAPATSTTSGRMGLASIDSLADSRGPISTEKTFYVWGAQLEAGTFPTSYIPTTASTVTRSADNASITGTNFSSWFNPSEGTIAVRVSNRLTLRFSSIYTFDRGSASVAFQLVNTSGSTSGEQIFARVDGSETNMIYSPGANSAARNPNHAYAYKNSDFGVAVNGVSYVLTSTSDVPSELNNLKIGGYTTAGYNLNGTISQLTYYPKRLSNDQLQNLTK